MMTTVSLIVTILAGLAALFFGRQLFWLFVGIVGFAVSFSLATELLTGQPDWLILLIALVVGVLGAVVAMFLQYIAVGVAGFLAGGYAVFSLIRIIDVVGPVWLIWLFIILGGVIGAALVLLLFDWALIILSASTGAALLAQVIEFPPLITTVVFLVLLAVGIAFQAYMLSGAETTTHRRVVHRVRRSD
jgi:hypothetical protein